MALETATYISDLVTTNPTGSDPLAQADDHLRLLKAVLKATFPNLAGPVSMTDTFLNQAVVPSGGIIMWSGSTTSVPTGWHICDGTFGTPDLRDKFVVGAGSTYAVSATGGSKDAIVPTHTHTYSGTSGTENAAHSHSGTTSVDGDHTHTYVESDFSGGVSRTYNTDSITHGTGTTSVAGAHAHSFTTGTESATHAHAYSGTTASTGVSAINANLPPYLALAYIMKL